jgi:hypothetical protein
MLYVIDATFDTLIFNKTVSKSLNRVCNPPPTRTPAGPSSTR